MSYQKRRRRKGGFNFKAPLWFLSISLLSLMFLSIWKQISPDNVIKDGYHLISGNKQKMSKNSANYELALAEKDAIISELKGALDSCENKQIYRIGIIDIMSETVNVRSKASLVSDIVLQIPNGSEVQILYFDTEKYYLEGRQGKWCRIMYAGQEGWVWGNFIRIPE